MKIWLKISLCVFFFGCSLEKDEMSPLTPIPNVNLTAQKNLSQSHLEQSLREATDRLFEAIRGRDSEKFLALCSQVGIEIGVDGKTSYSQLKEDLSDRKYVYCHYFDTDCLQENLKEIGHNPAEDIHGRLPMPVSYHELLNVVSELETSEKVQFWETGETTGWVGVKWKSPKPRDLGFIDFISFTFVLENGEWKLATDLYL